jgi:hypothetical protein
MSLENSVAADAIRAELQRIISSSEFARRFATRAPLVRFYDRGVGR